MTGDRWLLVIDFPDERVNRPSYDHMHSWFDTESEAQQTWRLLVEQLDGEHEHLVIAPPAICPRCGRGPLRKVSPYEPR